MEKSIKIIELARSLLGKPYKYGAKMEEAPDFFDCSGFVKYVFGQLGVDLPRSTIEQAVEGEKVDLENIEPGDLIFLRGSRGHYNPNFPEGIGHVGIYTENDTVMHAVSKRTSEKPIVEEGKVTEQKLSEYTKKWSPVVIKRVIG